MTAALEADEWSAARSGRNLPPGKTRYPFYRRLGRPQGRSGRAENLVPSGIRPRTVQLVVSRYTDWATWPAWSIVLTYLLTYSMLQSPSWEANWFAASQEIPRISRNPKVHYRTHKRPPPVSVLGQPSPVHIPTSHLLEIHPNIIHPSTPRPPQWSLSLRSWLIVQCKINLCKKKTLVPWLYEKGGGAKIIYTRDFVTCEAHQLASVAESFCPKGSSRFSPHKHQHIPIAVRVEYVVEKMIQWQDFSRHPSFILSTVTTLLLHINLSPPIVAILNFAGIAQSV